ncbi:MAG: DUF4349 domain-containing protein [Bacteroidales bacterium]|nr:DUF4349 domain-containing protein [Bacteroidales bacterium]
MRQYLLILITFTVLISSCNYKNFDENSDKYAGASYEIPIAERSSVPNPPPIPPPTLGESKHTAIKKIIKDGNMSIEVTDLQNSKKRVDSLVKLYNGYYAKESLNNYRRTISYNLKIRVPNNNFEKLVADVEKGKGKINSKEIDARDVTDEFIDVETRLNNKRSYLKRYNELLNKAKTIKDIVQIEDKISEIEEEIESSVARLKYLNDQVDYSTLTLNISSEVDEKDSNKDGFLSELIDSLEKGWTGFVLFLIILVRLWPMFLIAMAVIYIVRRARRKRREKQKRQ